MTGQQWERLKTLFHGALAHAPEERNGWLAEHAGRDEMLAREAAALIMAHETAEHFLEVPVEISPDDVTEASTLERHGGGPLGALERDIATGLRAHDAARQSTARRRGHFDQLIEIVVRRVRQLLD